MRSRKNVLKRLAIALRRGVGGLLLLSGAAQAQTIGISARQMPPRSLKWNLYYQGTEGQNLNFSQASGGVCAAGGAVNPSFACNSSGNVPATVDGNAIILQVTYQPWDNFQYYAGLGAGKLTLNVSSISVTNVLTGDQPGFLYHAGVRSVLIPDTVAGPAIAIDGRIGWQRYYFNEVHPFTTGAGQINQRLDMYQYQVAVEMSHRFEFTGAPRWMSDEPEPSGGTKKWALEPYGGVKWLRTQSSLKDLKNGGGSIGGAQDTFTPFVGLVVPVGEHEALTSEASFVNGIQYSAGLQVKF